MENSLTSAMPCTNGREAAGLLHPHILQAGGTCMRRVLHTKMHASCAAAALRVLPALPGAAIELQLHASSRQSRRKVCASWTRFIV